MCVTELPIGQPTAVVERQPQRKSQYDRSHRRSDGRLVKADPSRPLEEAGRHRDSAGAKRGLPAAERARQGQQHRLPADAGAAGEVYRHEESQHRRSAEEYANRRAFDVRRSAEQACRKRTHRTVGNRRGCKHSDVQKEFNDRNLPKEIHRGSSGTRRASPMQGCKFRHTQRAL